MLRDPCICLYRPIRVGVCVCVCIIRGDAVEKEMKQRKKKEIGSLK